MLAFQGNQVPESGYGVMNHYLVRELRRYVEVIDQPTEGEVPSVVLFGAPPNHVRWWWEGQKTMIFTMWETMTIPPPFRESIDSYDTVLVPSPHNVEMFSAYHPDVRYVPLGVDTQMWHPTRRNNQRPFTFLCMANSPRKGNDVAVKAFRETFGNSTDHRLVILDPRHQVRDRSNVVPIRYPVSNEELVALYEAAHCYLGPSRGEGFGFQPLQAIAQACPTILTDAHGHSQFSDLGIPVPAGKTDSYGFVHGDAGKWWEPDFDALCSAMLDVTRHFDQSCDHAWEQAHKVPDLWSWERSGRALLAELGDLSGSTGSGAKVEPQRRRFHLRVKAKSPCTIGGESFNFKPGIDYYEVADVKRVLFDAGLLEPSCVDPTEPGFSERELTHAGT